MFIAQRLGVGSIIPSLKKTNFNSVTNLTRVSRKITKVGSIIPSLDGKGLVNFDGSIDFNKND